MSVIGRLDSQVDEIIISPVSERRREEAPAADVRDEAPHEPREADRAPTPHTPRPGESSADAGELPVWLL